MQPSVYSITYYITYNLGHNILELSDILAKFPFIRSKVILDTKKKIVYMLPHELLLDLRLIILNLSNMLRLKSAIQ